MAIFWSASAPGFFDDAVHATIPGDAVAVTAKRHRDLMSGQARGSAIVTGKDGRPMLEGCRESLADRRGRLARAIRREAARRIDAIAPPWRQLNDMRTPSTEGIARFAAIDAIRAASNAIEANAAQLKADAIDGLDIAADPAWPTDMEGDHA